MDRGHSSTVVRRSTHPRLKRKSYTREEKLKILRFCHSNNRNVYRTCQKYGLNSKTLLRWLKDENKIESSRKGSKRAKFNRTPKYPEMEDRLYREYKDLRKRGLKVKAWWFKTKAPQILAETNPGMAASFCFSDSWFSGFKKRHRISLRRPTNHCQEEPVNKKQSIQLFHQKIRKMASNGTQLGSTGKWLPCSIANMDQTPLPFTFTDGSTYSDRGERSVWVRSGSSGLDKRQCTVQLTIFGDGGTLVKPLVIFRGKGKRISMHERIRYDRRVMVVFQENAWADENVTKQWIRQCWKPVAIQNNAPKLLVMDVHRAQTTKAVQDMLKQECNTDVIYVPGGCTGLVQPLDVSFNAPFKAVIDRLATKHMQSNLEDYVKGNINAGRRRILLTGWIGQAWEELSISTDMIRRSFKKTGITVAIDGSEDSEIRIMGIDDYCIPAVASSDDECDLFSSSDDESLTDDDSGDEGNPGGNNSGGDSGPDSHSDSSKGSDSEFQDDQSVDEDYCRDDSSCNKEEYSQDMQTDNNSNEDDSDQDITCTRKRKRTRPRIRILSSESNDDEQSQ